MPENWNKIINLLYCKFVGKHIKSKKYRTMFTSEGQIEEYYCPSCDKWIEFVGW